MNNFILISFLLGLFHKELISLMTSILKHPRIMYTPLSKYFSFFSNILSFLFKYLFYLYLIYAFYILVDFYIHFDDTFIKNMIIFSFDELENLSNSVNDPILNNTYRNNPSIPFNQIIDNIPNAIGATGAYHTAMKISEHVPGIPGKIIVGTIAAGFTASGVSFGLTLGENYAKKLFNDKTKSNFIQSFLSPLDKHTHFPDNILIEMFIMNSFAVSILIVLFNISIVNYIKNKNILQYLPEFIKSRKIFIIIEYFYNRYIRIWNISSKFIIIIAYIIIITDILLIHLGLYCILYL